MKDILIISIREITRLNRSKGLLFILVIWPFLAALLLGGIFSHKVVTKMPLAIINEDGGQLSRTLLRYTQASRSFDIAYHLESPQEAQDFIFKQKIVAALYIPKDFEINVKAGRGETLTLFVDGANLVTANLSIAEMKTIVATIAGGAKLKILRKLGYSKDKALALVSPIKMDVTKNFNPGTNYLNYMPPGTWMALLHQLILLFASLVIIREKEKNTFAELWSLSKESWRNLIIGKLLPYFMLFFFYFEIFFRLFFPLFDIEFKGNYQLMFFISSAFLYCTLSLGLLISVAVKRSIDAIKGVLLIGSPAFLISGYSWPLAYMPWLTKIFAYTIPLTYFIQAYRTIYQQGGGFGETWHNLVILLGYGTICLTLSIVLMKKQNKEAANVL